MTDAAGAAVRIAAAEGRILIEVSGDIDLANADEIERQITSAVTNQATAATLDLAQVTYIDSSGIRLLFNLGARLRTAQIVLTVNAPPGTAARSLIEVAGLPASVDVQPP